MKEKTKLKEKNILLVLGVIYTLVTILAVISYVSDMNNISTTPVTFSSVLSAIWWQLLMIALFIVTYFVYNKNRILGSLLEIIMGMSMLVFIVVSVVTMGANLLAILIELIYPLILIIHGLLVFVHVKKKSKKKRAI